MEDNEGTNSDDNGFTRNKSEYGHLNVRGIFSQSIKDRVREAEAWSNLFPAEQDSLDMIAHQIGIIVGRGGPADFGKKSMDAWELIRDSANLAFYALKETWDFVEEAKNKHLMDQLPDDEEIWECPEDLETEEADIFNPYSHNNQKRDKARRRILKMRQVKRITGLSESWIHELTKKGDFPKGFKFAPGGKINGWFSDEIKEWVDTRKKKLGI